MNTTLGTIITYMLLDVRLIVVDVGVRHVIVIQLHVHRLYNVCTAIIIWAC